MLVCNTDDDDEDDDRGGDDDDTDDEDGDDDDRDDYDYVRHDGDSYDDAADEFDDAQATQCYMSLSHPSPIPQSSKYRDLPREDPRPVGPASSEDQPHYQRG